MTCTQPAELAREYEGRKQAAVVVMARAPWTGGKKRLLASDDASHAELRNALFQDTLEAVRSMSDADHLIACEPADQTDAMQDFVGSSYEVMSQRGGSLGDRLANAFDDAFRRRYRAVVIVGSDIPDLPSHSLRTTLEALKSGTDQVVIGPARDGGYYLVGLTRPHRGLFQRNRLGHG
jgi:rSAM/selenodomain-associated transferase 1